MIVTTATTISSWPGTNLSEAALSNSSATPCIQGQLKVAVEQGGGLQVHTALGYTFLIVNTGAKSCKLRGFPRGTAFSTLGGEALKVSISHRRTLLYAQPRAQWVVLRPGRVASFGFSFTYQHAPFEIGVKNCVASFVDFRLPARASNFFTYEFDVRVDVCDAGNTVQVTPVENHVAPLA